MERPFNPPRRVAITSDDTEAAFVTIKPKSKTQKDDLYVYRYLNGFKQGWEVEWSETYLQTQLTHYFKAI